MGMCCPNKIRAGAVNDLKPYRHRFQAAIIQHVIWLYHRFPWISGTCRDLAFVLLGFTVPRVWTALNHQGNGGTCRAGSSVFPGC